MIQLENVNSTDELQRIAEENLDLLCECGFHKMMMKLELSDKVTMFQTVSLQKVILTSLAELTQFKDGMSALNVCDALKKHPNILYSFYCREFTETLTAGFFCQITFCLFETCFSDSVRELFTEVRFSEKGTNARMSEERTFMFFISYLEQCEETCS